MLYLNLASIRVPVPVPVPVRVAESPVRTQHTPVCARILGGAATASSTDNPEVSPRIAFKRGGFAIAKLCAAVLSLSVLSPVVLAHQEAPSGDAVRFVEANARRRASDLPLYGVGRVIRATISSDQELALQALIENQRRTGRSAADLTEELLALLPVREVRSISIWIESEARYAIEERRDAAHDTLTAATAARLSAHAPAATRVVLPSEVIRTLSASDEEWEVTARGVASLSPVPHRRQEVAYVDCGLVDWSPMLDPTSRVEGQHTTVEFDATTNSIGIVISSDVEVGDEVGDEVGAEVGADGGSLRHRFEDLERPRCVEIRSDWMRADYLSVEQNGSQVPSATFWRERTGTTGEWRLEARVFSAVEMGTAAQRPSWRLPSLRAQVTSDVATQSRTVRQVLPSWLVGVSVEEWYPIAAQHIASNWGSGDAESDLDGDGVVGAEDFVWVAEWAVSGS